MKLIQKSKNEATVSILFLVIDTKYSGILLGKKVAKGKDKIKEEKLRPSDDELRDVICEILKEVDFNTVSC